MGDIGSFFPDTDDRWKDANSMDLLAEVRRRVTAAGYTVVNVDATIVTEAPKLAPHLEKMRSRIASALRVPFEAVSVKAKTNEGMDAVGAGDGVLAFAVASLADE